MTRRVTEIDRMLQKKSKRDRKTERDRERDTLSMEIKKITNME